jgi:cell wall-associated NlpC family hydrolase
VRIEERSASRRNKLQPIYQTNYGGRPNPMRKKLLALIVTTAVSLSVIPVHVLATSPEAQKVIIVQTVNFRDQPSISGNRIRYLQPGETLDLMITYNSSWLQVKDTKGKVGYVSSSPSYIQFQSAAASPNPNGEILSSVSFRNAPSTDASRIRYLADGELVWVTEKVNSYWYKVTDKNKVTGYMSTNPRYIDTTFEQTEEEQPEASFPAPPNATVVSSVAFRTAPNTGASRIRYLSGSEKLLIINKTNDYWYKVQDQSGAIGFVSTNAKYISTTFVEPYKQLAPAIAAQKVFDAGTLYLGTPYEFGSSRYDITTFDCSDFVRQAYLDGIGQLLPGDSRSQSSYVLAVGKTSSDWRQLKKGDLLFFMSYKGYGASSYAAIDKSTEPVTHVGIYLGDGKILHTYSQASGGVRIDSIAGSQWEYRFLHGGSTY